VFSDADGFTAHKALAVLAVIRTVSSSKGAGQSVGSGKIYKICSICMAAGSAGTIVIPEAAGRNPKQMIPAGEPDVIGFLVFFADFGSLYSEGGLTILIRASLIPQGKRKISKRLSSRMRYGFERGQDPCRKQLEVFP
jgi:hypothetical protein